MGVPISVRLDEEVRRELESQATERGIGLATLLRELATRAAREAQDARIREESAAVARYVRSSPEAQAFYEDWGTPTANVG
jgi:antitoxin component of RelBE/YafQ-DinJ toxin-antitoxin module